MRFTAYKCTCCNKVFRYKYRIEMHFKEHMKTILVNEILEDSVNNYKGGKK